VAGNDPRVYIHTNDWANDHHGAIIQWDEYLQYRQILSDFLTDASRSDRFCVEESQVYRSRQMSMGYISLLAISHNHEKHLSLPVLHLPSESIKFPQIVEATILALPLVLIKAGRSTDLAYYVQHFPRHLREKIPGQELDEAIGLLEQASEGYCSAVFTEKPTTSRTPSSHTLRNILSKLTSLF
jgi:hypothetical protein